MVQQCISKRASRFKSILTTMLFILSSTLYAEGSISFLGEETDIADRTIRNSMLLSEYLHNTEEKCLSITSKTGHDHDHKRHSNKHKNKTTHAKHTLKKQVKCLKKSVKKLRKRKHKNRDISRLEWKTFKSLIKDFKKNGGIIDPEPEIKTSTIIGRVTTPAGILVSGAFVNIANNLSSTTSSTDGTFLLELEAGKEYVLQLTAEGYANQVIPVKSPSENGTINLDFTMISRGDTQVFVSEDGSTLSGKDGAEVIIDPNSFVDENGTPVTGAINLTITPVDVSNPASLAAFPGDFTGVTDAGETPIISFGTVEYQFTQNGTPVQLAVGATADILIPIYISNYQDGSAINLGDIIPLWSLNEETGIWLQEGTGMVVASPASPTGLAMRATVSHFTWWNCDVSMNSAQAIVTVLGSQAGTAVIKATTTANIGTRPGTVDTVTDIGVATNPLYIPSNGEVCFSADVNYIDGTSGTTLENCVNALPTSIVNITLTVPEAGPLNVVANGNDGPIDIIGFTGFNIEKIRLYPVSAESNVTYSILSGALPPGLTLNSIDAIRSEIVGTPTSSGSFTVEIGAVDQESTTDTILINFEVTSDTPPPMLDSFIFLETFNYNYNSEVFDLNNYNTGGLVSTWELLIDFSGEGSSPPNEIVLDPNTGLLTLSSCTDQNGYNIYWYGILSATNSSGSSEADIQVHCSPPLLF